MVSCAAECSGRAFNTGLFGVRNRPAAIAILKRWAYDLRDPTHEEYDVSVLTWAHAWFERASYPAALQRRCRPATLTTNSRSTSSLISESTSRSLVRSHAEALPEFNCSAANIVR